MRQRRLPYVFDRDQLGKLFDAITDPAVMMACLLALFCGLRKGEVVQLKREHVNLSTMKAKIVDAKNPKRREEGYGKDRYVIIPRILQRPIELWLEYNDDSTYIFPTITKPDHHLNDKYLFAQYKRALERAGLLEHDYTIRNGNKRCKYNFHTLRHSYATLLLERTGNLDLVRKALGHTNISTTLIYTHLSDRHLQEKVDETFGNRVAPKERVSLSSPSDAASEIADPYALLSLRVARGEISIEEYGDILSALKASQKTMRECGAARGGVSDPEQRRPAHPPDRDLATG